MSTSTAPAPPPVPAAPITRVEALVARRTPVAASGVWPDDPDERARLEQRRHPLFGDRRQELASLGVQPPADQLRDGPHRRPPTAEEPAAGEDTWPTWPDQFPRWTLDEVQPHAHQH